MATKGEAYWQGVEGPYVTASSRTGVEEACRRGSRLSSFVDHRNVDWVWDSVRQELKERT